MTGKITMHAVSRLMYQGKHLTQCVMPVQQNIRICVISPGGISTTPLTFILHNINPAVVECLVYYVHVFWAHHSKRFEGLGLCLLKCIGDRCLAH